MVGYLNLDYSLLTVKKQNFPRGTQSFDRRFGCQADTFILIHDENNIKAKHSTEYLNHLYLTVFGKNNNSQLNFHRVTKHTFYASTESK